MKQLKIGRSADCDIVIDDNSVSRYHAELFQDDEGNVFITDLNSSNGTFINGNKLVESDMLKQNDIVKIGTTILPWRNYLKEEVIEQPVDTNDFVSSNSIGNDIDEREDNSARNNALILTIAAVLGVGIIYFLSKNSSESFSWFSFVVAFILYGVVGLVALGLSYYVIRLFKINNPYFYSFLLIGAVYIVGGLSYNGAIGDESYSESSYEGESSVDENDSYSSTSSSSSSSDDGAPDGYKRGPACTSCDGTGYMTKDGLNYKVGDVCASCNAKGYKWVKK
jgi:pSer/pThr/pTyr-binding forkhead associated (FHA) protein